LIEFHLGCRPKEESFQPNALTMASQIGDDAILEQLNLQKFLTDEIVLNKSVDDVKRFLKERHDKRPKI
jgi:hypothetical protein